MSSAEIFDPGELLQFLYQTPYGVISADLSGNIDLMNAFASQLLMPIAAQIDFSQLYSILDALQPDLSTTAQQFAGNSGKIIDSKRFPIEPPNGDTHWVDVTLIKISEQKLMMGILDSTLLVEREKLARQEAEKRAEQSARLEMATSVIHDIGNAITSVGISAAKLVASDHWPEGPNLARIHNLLGEKTEGLDSLLGEGKGSALVGFIKSIEESLQVRHDDQISTAASIAKNIHHTQDIIRIQKQFARDGEGAPLLPVNLKDIFFHAESIIENQLDKYNIALTVHHADQDSLISGDKTRLTQVIVNILKNACEAIANRTTQDHTGIIDVFIEQDDKNVSLSIEDNGVGFDSDTKTKLSKGHFTSKSDGSGIGLSSCLSVVTSHDGEFSINSSGVNQGCTVSIILPRHS